MTQGPPTRTTGQGHPWLSVPLSLQDINHVLPQSKEEIVLGNESTRRKTESRDSNSKTGLSFV